MSTVERTIHEIPDSGKWTVHREDGSVVKIEIRPGLSELLRLAGTIKSLDLGGKDIADWSAEDLANVFDAVFEICGDEHRTTILGDKKADPPIKPLGSGVQLVIVTDIVAIATSALGGLQPGAGVPESDPTSEPAASSPSSAAGPKPSRGSSKKAKKAKKTQRRSSRSSRRSA